MGQTTEPTQSAAQCASALGGLRCRATCRICAILPPAAKGSDPAPIHRLIRMTYSKTQADFAATLATIRSDLYGLAMVHDKAERTVLMKAAAALALFESDTLAKAAGPLLPGER
jgi:hypothetical protein